MIKRVVSKRVKSVILDSNIIYSGYGIDSKLLPYVVDSVDKIKNKYGVKIGLTSHYNRKLFNKILDKNKDEGYILDSSVTIDEIKYKDDTFMIYRNMELQDTYQLESVVKVDNSDEGVKDGLNINCWTIAVISNRSYSEKNIDNLYPIDIDEIIENNKKKIVENHPHYIINSIIDIPLVLEDINERLEFGDRPCDHDDTYLLMNGKFIDSDKYFDNENKIVRYNRNMFLL